MPVLKDLFEESRDVSDYLSGYQERMAKTVSSLDIGALTEVVELIESTVASDGTIYVLGNGGSSAVAAHWVNDMGVNTLVDDQPGIRVFNLGDNASALTAVGNDISFEDVFAAQLRSCLRAGDLVVALSVSGNSPNVVRAIDCAQRLGARTVGFTGMTGGKVDSMVDVGVHTPCDTDEYGPIEDIFSICMHAITGFLAMRRGRRLDH